MKKIHYFTITLSLLFFSCSEQKQGDLLEIPIDIHQGNSLPLSEIAEEITAIELELTDESLISPIGINNIFISENEVFIVTLYRILVFNKEGKFLRSIGSRGQGPGEYAVIHHCALDEKNKRLFITTSTLKIIVYDLNGNFLKETNELRYTYCDLNYINEKLLLLVSKFNTTPKGADSHSALFWLSDSFQVIDSCTIMDLFLGDLTNGQSHRYSDFILKGSKTTYLYYGDFYNRYNFEERFLCDTLYRVENSQLIPELKLKFKNDGVSKFIEICNIYRSSRYIFAVYYNYIRKDFFIFCYDIKTGKGYNIQDGFSDDINQIFPARIRPFKLDTEMFYYLHTNMNPNDLEEPNPTLYIGRLKK